MAVKLPNGSTVFLATELDTEKSVTKVTNAAEAVITSTAHGFSDGDFVVLESGWGGLNGRVFKIGSKTTDTFNLVGFDTTNTTKFPAGSGVGKVRKVKTWQQILQITEVSMSGGDQQFVDFGFLEDDFDRQLPSTKSAASLTFTMADDPELPGYKAAAKASDAGMQTPLRIALKGGSELVYNGYPSLNKTPTLTRNQVMTVSLAYALSAEVNRY